MIGVRKVLADIRNGSLSLRQLPSFLFVLALRKLNGRYALPHEECGPATR